jgi:hypothetical protein
MRIQLSVFRGQNLFKTDFEQILKIKVDLSKPVLSRCSQLNRSS